MTKLRDVISIKKMFFVLLMLISLVLPISNALAEMMFSKGIYFLPTDISGNIVSNIDFFVDKCTFENNLVYFHGLNMGYGEWAKLGINGFPQSTQITLKQISTNKIEYNIYAPSGEGLTQIYIGSKGYPSKILGANHVELDEETKILTVYTIHTIMKTIPVELTFASSTGINTVAGLLAERKFVEAVVQIYTEVMGPYVFYGILFITVFGVAYIRTQLLIPVILLAFLLFSVLQPNIPTPSIQLGLVLMALGIGGIFYMLFVGRRR